jgi:hypothetical protein
MSSTVRALMPLTVFFLLTACHSPVPPGPGAPAPAAALAPSPNLIVGHVIAVDTLRHFAVIDVASTAPLLALTADHELLARSDDLRITARLRTTRQLRVPTLGTLITAGAPNLGDEVVLPSSP